MLDGLHLNATGYAIWAEVVRSRLHRDRAETPALPERDG